MSLPQIKQPVFTYTGIEYRGFTHAEEKILLQMKEDESAEKHDVLNNIIKIVEQCTFNKTDVNNLELTTLEMLFIKIRTKSVGEIHKIKYICKMPVVMDGPKCGNEMIVTLDLDKVELTTNDGVEEKESEFMLDDTIGIKMRPATVAAMMKFKDDPSLDIACYIDYAYDKEQIYKFDDMDVDEIDVFVSSIPTNKKQKMKEYIGSLPKTTLTVHHECDKCGHNHELNFSGLNDFFG